MLLCTALKKIPNTWDMLNILIKMVCFTVMNCHNRKTVMATVDEMSFHVLTLSILCSGRESLGKVEVYFTSSSLLRSEGF